MLRLLALMALLLLPLQQAWADKLELDDGVTVVGIPSETYVELAAPESTGLAQHEHWGWAACLQQILNYHGLYLTQEDLVKRVLGEAKDEPVQPGIITARVSGWEVSGSDGVSTIHLKECDLELPTILRDLEHNWPPIVGLTMPSLENVAAQVLTGVFYTGDQSEPTLTKVVLRNPAGDGSKLELTGAEFRERLRTVVRVYVERPHPEKAKPNESPVVPIDELR